MSHTGWPPRARPRFLLALGTFAVCLPLVVHADDDIVVRRSTARGDVQLDQRADIGLAALNLYSTFGCIGLAAEGWEAKLYDADNVARIMQDVSRSSNLAVRLLQKSIKDEPKLKETTPIQEMIDCYVLLDRQAHLLTESAKGSDKRLQQTYRQVRDESWQKIAAALGIEP